MIKTCKDYNDIIPLWQEAFGDSEEDIRFFCENVNNAECIVYCHENSIASMMYLVDCKVGEKRAKYIYAACTFKKYKGMGYMSELINYCIKKYSDSFTLCLIPASDSLIEFYTARGIGNIIDIDKITFEQSEDIKEYLLEGYNLSVPCALTD